MLLKHQPSYKVSKNAGFNDVYISILNLHRSAPEGETESKWNRFQWQDNHKDFQTKSTNYVRGYESTGAESEQNQKLNGQLKYRKCMLKVH